MPRAIARAAALKALLRALPIGKRKPAATRIPTRTLTAAAARTLGYLPGPAATKAMRLDTRRERQLAEATRSRRHFQKLCNER